LLAGKGTKPFRLASVPVFMPAQEANAGGWLMVMLSIAFAVCTDGVLESVTPTTTEVVPPCVGVPVIAPVAVLIDNPLGRLLAL